MIWKTTFIFQSGNSGWSETYYRDRTTAANAADFTAGFWRGFFTPRGDAVVCTSIRVSDPAHPRSGTLFKILQDRTDAGLAGNVRDEPASAAMELAAASALPSRRTIFVRGLKDYSYPHNPSGAFLPTALMRSDFIAFANVIRSAGLQLRHLRAATVGNPDKPLLSMAAGEDGGRSTQAIFTGAPAVQPGTLVIFHRLPRNLFPGFRQPVPVASIAGNTLTFPVRWTGPQPSVVTPGAVARLAEYDYSGITEIGLSDFRSRRTGRPSNLPHGRRSAVSYRPR